MTMTMCARVELVIVDFLKILKTTSLVLLEDCSNSKPHGSLASSPLVVQGALRSITLDSAGQRNATFADKCFGWDKLVLGNKTKRWSRNGVLTQYHVCDGDLCIFHPISGVHARKCWKYHRKGRSENAGPTNDGIK